MLKTINISVRMYEIYVLYFMVILCKFNFRLWYFNNIILYITKIQHFIQEIYKNLWNNDTPEISLDHNFIGELL